MQPSTSTATSRWSSCVVPFNVILVATSGTLQNPGSR